MVKYIIFDCDGVLVDTEIVAAKIMVEKLEALGIKISLEQYINECSGKTFKLIFEKLMPNEKIQQIDVPSLITSIESEVAESLVPIKGVKKAIDTIRHPKAVVSNSGMPQISHALHEVGITGQFEDRVFSASMVSAPKPSPLVYQLAANTLGIKPEECLVIEDSTSGVKAATTAGMTTIGFTGASHIQNGHDLKLLNLGAVEIFDDMDKLPEIIHQHL